MSDLSRYVDGGKYDLMVEHLKQIVQPHGAWNNDLSTYLANVVKECITHAESALDLLEEDYQSLSESVKNE